MHNARTIAFPSISTGIYGYPKDKAARIAVNTVMQHIEATSLLEVRFVAFTPDDHAIYRAQVDRACPACGQGVTRNP